MDKLQALHKFWSSFGWPAYNEKSVPDEKELPYITYEASYSDFGNQIAQTAQLHDRATGWSTLYGKAKEIEQKITRGGVTVPYDGGAFHIYRESPWAQEGLDQNPYVRIIFLNYSIEYWD